MGVTCCCPVTTTDSPPRSFRLAFSRLPSTSTSPFSTNCCTRDRLTPLSCPARNWSSRHPAASTGTTSDSVSDIVNLPRAPASPIQQHGSAQQHHSQAYQLRNIHEAAED